MSKRFLITGATGFLGRHLLSTLPTDAEKWVLVRDARAFHALPFTQKLKKVRVIEGELFGFKVDEQWPARFDGIFHCAALVDHARERRDEVFKINVEGTLALVRLAAEMQSRVVFVSSSGTVGCFRQSDEWADEQSDYENAAVGDWPYYRSKQQAEQQAAELASTLGVSLVIMRPPVLLGPGDHRYRSTGHILRLAQGRLPFVLAGGMNFTDVRDVAKALWAAMKHPNPKKIYHLPGHECSLSQFFDRCIALGVAQKSPQEVPFAVAKGMAGLCKALGPVTLGKSASWFPDPVVVEMASRHWGIKSRYAANDLKYQPRSGTETLRDTLDWLTENPPPQ
ncbi:MAG: NAD-dependent epimerase [Myxococcales bacterium]|nr:NAD-dependent epimerase [Myxococcales bacterium]